MIKIPAQTSEIPLVMRKLISVYKPVRYCNIKTETGTKPNEKLANTGPFLSTANCMQSNGTAMPIIPSKSICMVFTNVILGRDGCEIMLQTKPANMTIQKRC